MEVRRPIDTTDETLGYVYIRCCTDDEMDHSLGLVTGALDQRLLPVEKWFVTKILKRLQRCVNVLRANHAIEQFTKKVP